MDLLKYSLFIWNIVNIAYANHWLADFEIKDDNKRSIKCKTTSGPEPNVECVFPFKYRDKVYNECTIDGASKPWCCTKTDSGGNHLGGHWGYCGPDCNRKAKIFEPNEITVPEATTPFNTCKDAELCVMIPITTCSGNMVKKECPKKCGICKSNSFRAPSLNEFLRAKSFLRDIMFGDNIPATVRLAFHDCVGPNGCDGCINLKISADNGLQPIITLLVAAKNDNFPSISNADFWQIAGIVALENANPRIKLSFVGGRPDCPTSPSHNELHEFPNPNMTRSQMMNWFMRNKNGFGMHEREVTALMGAHSLGRARKENSGYRFSWTPGKEHIFDNEMYQLMANFAPIYANENQTDKGDDLKYEWVVKLPGGKNCMLLNTDMELLYDIDVDNAGKGTQCVIPLFDTESEKKGVDRPFCKPANTKNLVEVYARSEEFFLSDFQNAYHKMMTAKIKEDLKVPQ